MAKPIVQSVTFKASPEDLFSIFTDSKKHSAATGVALHWIRGLVALNLKVLSTIPGFFLTFVSNWSLDLVHPTDNRTFTSHSLARRTGLSVVEWSRP
jgi:hypothetical protein